MEIGLLDVDSHNFPKHVFDYEHDCSHLPNQIISETTELKISCTEFFPVAPTVREAAR